MDLLNYVNYTTLFELQHVWSQYHNTFTVQLSLRTIFDIFYLRIDNLFVLNETRCFKLKTDDSYARSVNTYFVFLNLNLPKVIKLSLQIINFRIFYYSIAI